MNRFATRIARTRPSARYLNTQAARAMPGLSREALGELEKYTACDISDALLKLKVPQAGFLRDMNMYGVPGDKVVIAPVSTIMFVPKGAEMSTTGDKPSNIPRGKHWTDVTEPGTIAVLHQPEGQSNAVCGGILALRMMMRGVQGIVVAGRVRDIDELKSTKLPVSHV